MVDIIQLGPFQVKVEILIVVVSAIVGYGILRIRLKNEKERNDAIMKILSGVFLVSILVWKGSYVLFHPLKMVEQPVSILYFTGGEKGAWLAVVAGIIYIWVMLRKHEIPLKTFAASTLTGLLAAWGVFHSLQMMMYEGEDLFHLLQAVVSVIFLMWLLNKSFSYSRINDWIQFVLWMSISQVFILFFKEFNKTFVLGLSQSQLLFLMLAILCLLTDNVRKKGSGFNKT